MISATLVLVPLVTATVLLFARSRLVAQLVAMSGAIATFLVATVLLGSEPLRLDWIPGFGATISFDPGQAGGVLALVATVVMGVTVLWAAARVEDRSNRFLAALFAMWSGLMGLFLARDLVLFYLFWEATLLPSLALLGGWGGPRRRQALLKYLLYAVAGSFAMLLTIAAIKPLSGAASYHFSDLLAATVALDTLTQTWLFAGFALAFAVKLPMFPLHHWLIDFHEQNHPSGAADVAGTLYKVGGFGLFAWALPLLPEGARQAAPLLLALGAFTAVYAAVIAARTHHLKRLLAYASLSHMGLVAVGLFGLHLAGLSGAMYLLTAQMATTGGLFLITGMLHARRGSFDADSYGGLAASAPALAAVTLLVLFASIGVPGLANFPGEFLALLGAFQASVAAGVLAVLAVVAAGVYGVNLYQRIYQGSQSAPVRDLNLLEVVVLIPIIATTLWLGVAPGGPLRTFEADATVSLQRTQTVEAPAHLVDALGEVGR